jgi:hypothetical protein
MLYQNVTLTQWRRLSIVHPSNVTDALALETRNVPVGAGAVLTQTDTVAYGAQGEPVGAYPTSYIPTMSAPATRDREKLYAENTGALLPNGFLNVTLKIAPNFNMASALNEQISFDYHLLHLEDKTRLYLHRDDRKLYLTIEGAVVSSAPLAFAREQELTITIKHQDGANTELTVAGANEGNGTYTGMPAFSVNTAKLLYILSKDAGAEECADLRYIAFY